MNIVVSGWPGAGSSTLALLLSYYHKYKLLRGTQTFRLIGSKLGYELTGEDRIKADTYLEEYWGPVYDKYVDYILLNFDNYLVESDIAAFRIGLHDNIFSIFLAPSLESRQKRLASDGRPEEIPLVAQREKDLQRDYINLNNQDWLDLEVVRSKHNLVLDTSYINLADELKIVYESLEKSGQDFKQIEKDFWNNGKDFYINELQNNDLLISTEEIIRNITKTFRDDIELMPSKLKNIICNI